MQALQVHLDDEAAGREDEEALEGVLTAVQPGHVEPQRLCNGVQRDGRIT